MADSTPTDPALAADAAVYAAHLPSVPDSPPLVGVDALIGNQRHSLTLDQRRALRRWANAQPVRPSHKACIDWFFAQYGKQISQSTVSHSLSPKYSRLDHDNPQLSGSRLRFGNWPDVEKLVLRWYQQVLATGRTPTNEELGEKAKTVFSQLPRYKEEAPPEFSPGWIHRFKKRYGLLTRRQRRHGDPTMDPANDIAYLAEYIPRFMDLAPDTSPAAIREQILRTVGVEATLNTCALVRDEVVRRLTQHDDGGLGQTDPHAMSHPHHEQQLYADDDPEVVLQNALRQLQQEEQAAEEQAAAVREERDRQDRAAAGLAHAAMAATPVRPSESVEPRYASPPHDLGGAELTLTPIHSDGPVAANERPLRCPFCVNQRMLRTIREAVEHMSTHVIV